MTTLHRSTDDPPQKLVGVPLEQPAGESTRRRAGWRSYALALALGVPPAFAFPEPGWWWLGFIGLVPLLLYVARAPSGRQAAVRAWFGGAGYGMVLVHWVVPKVGPGIVPAAFLLAIPWALWGAIAFACLSRERRPARMLAALMLVPAAFVVGDFVRSWEHLGGPWGLIGASQWRVRPVLALAALGGVWGVSFLLVFVNVALACVLLPGATRAKRLGAILAAVGAVGATLAYGSLDSQQQSAGSIRVAGVQPGPNLGGMKKFRAALDETRSLASVRPDLVAWGESSVGGDRKVVEVFEDDVAAVASEVGAPVLVNVDSRRGSGGIFKTSLLIGPRGRLGQYDKMRLVPFGEYIPLRSALGWLTRLSEAADEDRKRGSSLAVLKSGSLSLGALVCFESTFPDLPRHLAAGGADVIVVQSSTSTFQESWGPEQLASLAAVRAVESGRPVVHATLTGVSAAFDAQGRRLEWFGTDKRGGYVADVPLSEVVTPYVRFGDWVPAASLVVLVASLLVTRFRGVTGEGATSAVGQNGTGLSP